MKVINSKPKRSNEESHLQKQCVQLMRRLWPHYSDRFFAIPNGEKRNEITGKILNGQGVLAGVLDCFLAVPSGGWSGAFLEFKSPTGRLSPAQFKFIENVRLDYKVIIVRSQSQFISEIDDYLQTNKIRK